MDDDDLRRAIQVHCCSQWGYEVQEKMNQGNFCCIFRFKLLRRVEHGWPGRSYVCYHLEVLSLSYYIMLLFMSNSQTKCLEEQRASVSTVIIMYAACTLQFSSSQLLILTDKQLLTCQHATYTNSKLIKIDLNLRKWENTVPHTALFKEPSIECDTL